MTTLEIKQDRRSATVTQISTIFIQLQPCVPEDTAFNWSLGPSAHHDQTNTTLACALEIKQDGSEKADSASLPLAYPVPPGG